MFRREHVQELCIEGYIPLMSHERRSPSSPPSESFPGESSPGESGGECCGDSVQESRSRAGGGESGSDSVPCRGGDSCGESFRVRRMQAAVSLLQASSGSAAANSEERVWAQQRSSS